MTASQAEGNGEAPKAPNVWTYDALITASIGMAALSKIGTKNKDMLKRLAKMMMWNKATTQSYFLERDTPMNTWAERDEAGEIKVNNSDGGKSQAPIFRNMIEYQLAANEMLRGPATFEGDPPDPFTWEDLEKFVRLPDAETIAQLGPFAKI